MPLDWYRTHWLRTVLRNYSADRTRRYDYGWLSPRDPSL